MSWLGLVNTNVEDIKNDHEDPQDPELLKELDGVIDRYITKAENYPDLQQTGEDLRKRIHTVGFQSASSLGLIAKKPPER